MKLIQKKNKMNHKHIFIIENILKNKKISRDLFGHSHLMEKKIVIILIQKMKKFISNMRIGMIARYDNSGLGTLSWEFARHLKPSKVVLVANGVYQKFPERYVEFENRISRLTSRVDEDSQKWLLEDIDVLLTFETFYSWELIKKAKDKGIKTAL